jgi:hypothetical protein
LKVVENFLLFFRRSSSINRQKNATDQAELTIKSELSSGLFKNSRFKRKQSWT